MMNWDLDAYKYEQFNGSKNFWEHLEQSIFNHIGFVVIIWLIRRNLDSKRCKKLLRSRMGMVIFGDLHVIPFVFKIVQEIVKKETKLYKTI